MEQMKPSYRDLAKKHAQAASEMAWIADEEHARTQGLSEAYLDMAQMHALVSLACSAVAPPVRRERCRSPHVRTVDLAEVK